LGVWYTGAEGPTGLERILAVAVLGAAPISVRRRFGGGARLAGSTLLTGSGLEHRLHFTPTLTLERPVGDLELDGRPLAQLELAVAVPLLELVLLVRVGPAPAIR
jgi:hypothetical protein